MLATVPNFRDKKVRGDLPGLTDPASAAAEAFRFAAERRKARKARQAEAVGGHGDDDEDAATADEGGDQDLTWRDELLSVLKQMDPIAFERLAMRLLREADFVNLEVTKMGGDDGIDGVGVYKPSLVSFPIYFQCKRYQGTVGPGVVRDFRGAMTGRGEKGLVITTGTFGPAAKKEATRDGAPPVDLIDGDELCNLLKQYRLGVSVSERVEEDVVVQASFFSDV